MVADQEAVLRQTLVEKPRNGRAMAQLACQLAENAKTEPSLRQEALFWANRSIAVSPQKPFGYAALSLIEEDRHKRIKSLEMAIEKSTHPSHTIACIDLMVRLLVEPRDEEAKQVKGKIGSASSQHPHCRALDSKESKLYHQIIDKLGNIDSDALTAEEREFIALREYRLGTFLRKKQQWHSKSAKHFHRSIDLLPSNHPRTLIAKFWIATMDDKNCIATCPKEYIVGLYSTFAATFDELLVKQLSYQTPTILRTLLDSVVDNAEVKWDKAADLGCGTGLSGVAFRDRINELIGVDLSPEMIEQATERKCYDKIIVGDITDILIHPYEFGLIFACDVFVYIGDLEDVFTKAYHAMKQSGIFAFSTELLDEFAKTDYRLHECARFAHKQSYIQSLAARTGFEIVATKICPIRKNQGKDVIGALYITQR